MPKNSSYLNFILDEKQQITDFIDKVSIDMYEYIISHSESNFVLFYKYITHSDLATFGKATKHNSLQKNLLYYLDDKEMAHIESSTGKPFQTAHQSCIGLMKELYNKVGLPQPRDTQPYLINDYMNVFIVSKNMQYFNSDYTFKIFDKLNKKIDEKSIKYWNHNKIDFIPFDSLFTPIRLHVAVHGLGMSIDEDFHKIRHHIFKGDTFILLFEINASRKNNMFILFEKNPIFFSILGETNKAYESYQKNLRRKLIDKTLLRENAVDFIELEEEITRQQQSVWRKMLANEMMGYSQVEGQLFCPFTYITANFENLSPLFVASHIKGFKDPNTSNEEKYDINNGILLCSNADALFDKHLITVSDKKELIFSFLIDNDTKLKSQLLLLQPIFHPILNEKRMKYLAYHRQRFFEKESARRNY